MKDNVRVEDNIRVEDNVMSTPSTMTPRAFVDKWAAASAKESAAAQEHFLDLCRLVGHPTPMEADPEGRTFCFEAGATKQSGGQGWADVWKRGFFAWEYKGQHADLDKAYDQLLQYREALENPPLLVVSDMATIRIHTNFTNTVKQVYELTLEDVLDPAKRRILHDLFFNPEGLRARQTPAQVTERAAEEFGRLAEQLYAYGGADSTQVAHFLIRLLFCLFAEDAGLLPEALFSKLIEATRGQSKAFQAQLQQLFAAMRDGGWFGYDRILHFNGRLFDDARALELDGSGHAHAGADQRAGLVEHRAVDLRHALRAEPGPREAVAVGRALHQPRRHPADRGAGADGAAAPAVGGGEGAGARGGGGTRRGVDPERSDAARERACIAAAGVRAGDRGGAGVGPGVRERELPLRGAAAAAGPGEGGDHAGGAAGGARPSSRACRRSSCTGSR